MIRAQILNFESGLDRILKQINPKKIDQHIVEIENCLKMDEYPDGFKLNSPLDQKMKTKMNQQKSEDLNSLTSSSETKNATSDSLGSSTEYKMTDKRCPDLTESEKYKDQNSNIPQSLFHHSLSSSSETKVGNVNSLMDCSISERGTCMDLAESFKCEELPNSNGMEFQIKKLQDLSIEGKVHGDLDASYIFEQSAECPDSTLSPPGKSLSCTLSPGSNIQSLPSSREETVLSTSETLCETVDPNNPLPESIIEEVGNYPQKRLSGSGSSGSNNGGQQSLSISNSGGQQSLSGSNIQEVQQIPVPFDNNPSDNKRTLDELRAPNGYLTSSSEKAKQKPKKQRQS